MANKNRKDQNGSSANHTTTSNAKDQVKDQGTNQEKNQADSVNNETSADVRKSNTSVQNSVKKSQLKSKGKNRGNNSASSSFDAAVLWDFIKTYKRYLAAGALFVAMVVILAKCTGPVTDAPKEPVQDEQTANQPDLTEAFQVDAIPEVNTLISSYYEAYAKGDVAALEPIAQPMSETEKSYIKVFSEYVESFEKLSCYTKSGLCSGEYVVSVYLEMKFKDVATAAPGLDFFYVRTNENGELYIDNAYSQFNQSNMEKSTDADVQALINEFEQADDVVELQSEVQQKYEQAVASDAQLDEMANEVIPNAIGAWVQSLKEVQDKPSDEEAAQGESADDSATEDNSDDKTSDEEKKENSDGDAKTAYAMDGINLRKGPGTNKEVLTQIPLGGKLKIYPDTEKDGWVKATYGGKKGYVKREYVTTKQSKVPSAGDTAQEDTSAQALPAGKEVTLSDSVNVRVSMSETASKVGLAYQGDTVKVIQSYAEGWTKVEWNGQTGYIKTELIK